MPNSGPDLPIPFLMPLLTIIKGSKMAENNDKAKNKTGMIEGNIEGNNDKTDADAEHYSPIGTREEMVEANRRRLELLDSVEEDIFENQKSALIDKWENDELLKSEILKDAFKSAKREYFIDKKNTPYTYYEQDFSITDDIVAPDIATAVDVMELAQLKPGMKVLLIGCSSGYEEELLLKMRCTVDVLDDNIDAIAYSRAKLEVLYAEDNIPAYFTTLSEVQGKYDRVIGFKSIPKLRRELFRLVDTGRMVICLGDEKILVTLDFDGTSHPLMKFIGSLYLPPISFESLGAKEN